MTSPIEAVGLVVREPGAPPRMETLEVDPPGRGDVRVRMLASGICHTDLLVAEGRSWWPDYPYVLGHEGAGIIESVGEGVDPEQIGTPVVLAWRAPCGRCRMCRADRGPWCLEPRRARAVTRLVDGRRALPSLRVGSHASVALVAAEQAIAVSDGTDPEALCLIGCAVLTGVGAVLITAAVPPGRSVAVFGCGGVGLSVVGGARLARAGTIVAVDRDPERLELARGFGATHTVVGGTATTVAEVRAITEGIGVDHAFDAVGVPSTFLDALGVCDTGGSCTILGTPDPDATASVPLGALYFPRLAVRVSQYGDCVPSRDVPLLERWFRDGSLPLRTMISRVLTPEQAPDGLDALREAKAVWSVIRFPSPTA